MPGRPAPEARIHVDNRRLEAARLKERCWTLEAIGRHLHADPAFNSRHIAVPEGYGIDRYRDGRPPAPVRRLTQEVSRDLRRAFLERMGRLDESVDALRIMRVGQYETLLRPLLDDLEHTARDAADPDLDPDTRAKAWDRQHKIRDQMLRVFARLDEVQGVKRPVRAELSGPAGGPVQIEQHIDVSELEQLIAVSERATHGTSTTPEADAEAEEDDEHGD